MPLAPFASVRASINGGAITSGGLTVAGGSTVQLSADPAGLVGATQVRWELLGFPAAFTVPAGWSTAPDGSYFSTDQTPPPFTVLSSANWGKYTVRLLLNGGGPSLSGRETVAQLTAIQALSDLRTALSVASVDGLVGVGYYEEQQFSSLGWVEALNHDLRLLQLLLTSAGGGSATSNHSLLSSLTADDHTQYDLARRPLQDYTAASNDLALADARRCVTSTRATAIALRIRTQANIPWLAETLLGGINVGAGALTLTAEGGVTLNGSVTVPQHGWWWAKRTGLNTWQCFTGGNSSGTGDLKADGSVAMTGSLDVNGQSLVDVKRITVVAYDGYGSSGAAKTIVAANGDLQKLLLTADCTVSFTLGSDPCSFTVLYRQNVTGGWEITHTGPVDLETPVALDPDPDAITVVNYLWDGSTLFVSAAGSSGGGGGGGSGQTGIGFPYTFATSTTDADPGAGTFRYNNATLGSVTQVYVDLSAYAGGDVSDWLATIDDAIGTTKGYLWVRSQSDATKWAIFRVTGRTAGSGYDKFDVVLVDSGAGGLPTTTAGDTVLAFDALGRLDAVNLASQVTGQLPFANLADGTACAFLARGANSTGLLALVSVGTNGFVVLRRSNVLTAGLLLDENIDPAAAVAGTKIAPAFGAQAVTATATSGHSFGAAAASATILETFDVSGRAVLALLFGAAPTATELPSSGGNRVLQFGESLSWPVVKPGGNALFSLGSHDTHGLGVISKNGVETTVAPNGNSTAATRKIGQIRLHYYQTGIASTAEFSAIEADANGVNGAALPNGTYEITFTAITEQTGGSLLRHVVRASRLVKKQGGTLSAVGSVYLNAIAGDSSPPSTGTIDVDGTLIRGRVALASSTATNVTGYLEIRGTAP